MKTKADKQIDIYEVVNIDKKTNEIDMLDYLFNHGLSFKGATGTKFEPVSKEEYKDRTSKENVIDQIIEIGIPAGFERERANGVYKAMKANKEIDRFVFDLSYTEHWNKLRKFGFPKSKYPIFNCIGGGRMFDNKYNGNVNPELNKKIREYESK